VTAEPATTLRWLNPLKTVSGRRVLEAMKGMSAAPVSRALEKKEEGDAWSPEFFGGGQRRHQRRHRRRHRRPWCGEAEMEVVCWW